MIPHFSDTARWLLFARSCGLGAAFLIWVSTLTSPNRLSADELTFEKDIRPIFRAYCFDCHGATDQKEGELDLRQVRLMIQGGESGPAIEKSQSAGSLLVERIESGEMPPGDHRVSQKEIDNIKSWIDAGAPTARAEPKTIPRGLGISQEERNYWAFQPIRRPPVPVVKATDRVRNPIDSFLLAKLEAKGLTFAPDAKQDSLIRRASLDLLGLPPQPDRVKKFLADHTDHAWPQLVEEYLASQHYGERWGRHWLDVAGYADSEGANELDQIRPWAYKYRDWVIKALNRDLPFDQFIQWQLAGDEIAAIGRKNRSGPDLSDREIELLTATGFLRMASDGTGRTNSIEQRNAVMTDTIEIVSSSLLGLSVKCAQCHDHRYDPISHEDYYRLRAVFEPALNVKQWNVPRSRLVSLYTEQDKLKAAEIEKRAVAKSAERNERQVEYMKQALEGVLAKLDEKLRGPLRTAYMTPAKQRSPDQIALLQKHPSVGAFSPGVLYQYNKAHADELKALDAEIARIRSEKPVHEYLRAVSESRAKTPPKTMLFHRGDYRQPKYAVQPGSLTVCAAEDSPLQIAENDPQLPTTGRRLAYARWLTSGRHPLVARVLVNRVWRHHFGKSFVATPDEFGKLGSGPTHPELLDWLADEFMAKGWSLKHLHRLIMNSTAYRQASTRHALGNSTDQDNLGYWHYPVQRLDAEVIRDSILSVSGRLDLQTQFGKPVSTQADESGQIVVPGAKQRRSIYLQVRRTQPISILESFDAPVMKVNCAARSKSTVATQSLMLMNSEFVLSSARAFATRLNSEADKLSLPNGYDLKIDDTALMSQAKDPWKYGYGFLRILEPGSAKVEFTPLPAFHKGTWKGGEKLPDEKIGWSFLTATGGHPDHSHGSTIRRWVSPLDGKLRVTGTITHHSKSGDGVELTVVNSQHKKLKQVTVHSNSQNYQFSVSVAAGEVIDFIVSARGNHTSDSFSNQVKIEQLAGAKVVRTWDSVKDFRGPLQPVHLAPVSKQIFLAWQLAYGRSPSQREFQLASEFLSEQFLLLAGQGNQQPVEQALVNLCQAILGSNEFLYLD